jgi:hypothetical protein
VPHVSSRGGLLDDQDRRQVITVNLEVYAAEAICRNLSQMQGFFRLTTSTIVSVGRALFIRHIYLVRNLHDKKMPTAENTTANIPTTAKSTPSCAKLVLKIVSCLTASVVYVNGLTWVMG